MVESVNPSVRQLLSTRVRTSIRDRGEDPTEMLREEPNTSSREMTEEERAKQDRKREKNRQHAKQSRERRNLLHAKTEEENKVLKLERNILRSLNEKNYREKHDSNMTWREVTVECPVSISTQSPQGSRVIEYASFCVLLPSDISTESLPPSCKYEDLYGLYRELFSHGNMKSSTNARDRTKSTANAGIDIPTRGQTTALNHSRLYETNTSNSYESMSDCEFLLEESSPGSHIEDSFFSLRQVSTEKVGVTDVGDSINRVVNVPTDQATKGFSVKEEMNEETHSPWMVSSGRENKPPELSFNKKRLKLQGNFSHVKNLHEKSIKRFPSHHNPTAMQDVQTVSFLSGSKKTPAVGLLSSPIKNNIGPLTNEEIQNTKLKERKPLPVTQMSTCEPSSHMEIKVNSQMSGENLHCQEFGTFEADRHAFQENAMEDSPMHSEDFQATHPVTESSMDDSSVGLNVTDDERSSDVVNHAFFQFDSFTGLECETSEIRSQAAVERPWDVSTADANGSVFSGPPSTLSSLNLGGMEFVDVEAIFPTVMMNHNIH